MSTGRLSPRLLGRPQIGPLPSAGRHNHNSAGRAGGTSAPAARVFAGDYTASTATTPATALMAPAICGETLKRPGSFTSTSVPSLSISTLSQKRLTWLRSALNVLNDRELRIVSERRLRDEGATLESLGESLGISKERVRQIENRALEKLRHALLRDHPDQVSFV